MDCSTAPVRFRAATKLNSDLMTKGARAMGMRGNLFAVQVTEGVNGLSPDDRKRQEAAQNETMAIARACPNVLAR